MQYIHRKWVLWAWAIIALGCLGPAQPSTQAQNTVAGWPERNFTVEKSQPVRPGTRNNVAKSLKNGTFEGSGDEKIFADYYNQSLFPNVTNPTNRQSPKDDVIPKLRSDLAYANGNKPREGEGPKDQQVFNKLAELTLAYMTKIANDGQYHPAARVNAMLLIGEVNSAEAAKLLLETAFSKGPVIFPIRVAAMTGLVRMAGLGGRGLRSDPEIEALALKNMVPFVKFHATKGDRADGINWMRGQAADVLADLGNPGAQGEVPPALLTMLGDKDLPIPLRSKAARALGKLNYGGNPPSGPYVAALAEFARDALSSDQPADRARVRLVARDVTDGLKPLAASAPTDDRALVDGLQKTLQTLNTDTEKALTTDDLKKYVNKAQESLDSLLKNR